MTNEIRPVGLRLLESSNDSDNNKCFGRYPRLAIRDSPFAWKVYGGKTLGTSPRRFSKLLLVKILPLKVSLRKKISPFRRSYFSICFWQDRFISVHSEHILIELTDSSVASYLMEISLVEPAFRILQIFIFLYLCLFYLFYNLHSDACKFCCNIAFDTFSLWYAQHLYSRSSVSRGNFVVIYDRNTRGPFAFQKLNHSYSYGINFAQQVL